MRPTAKRLRLSSGQKAARRPRRRCQRARRASLGALKIGGLRKGSKSAFKLLTDHRMHPRAKVSPETCKFRRHGCPLAKSCQCQTHSINLHVRGVSDVARTVIRSNTCMDETDEAAGRGSEAEKPPGADLPSIARGATPGHERDTTRAMELRAASRLRADHLGASRTAFRLRFDRVVT